MLFLRPLINKYLYVLRSKLVCCESMDPYLLPFNGLQLIPCGRNPWDQEHYLGFKSCYSRNRALD